MGAKQSTSATDTQTQGEQLPAPPSPNRRSWTIEGGPSRILNGQQTRPSSARFVRSRRNRDSLEESSDLGSIVFAIEPQSLPASLHMFNFDRGIKCPACSKMIQVDVLEDHLVECLSKPRVNYNESKLTADAGECVICFEDMDEGQTIARLPCLCIYHKHCIDRWFEVSRCCPAHPDTR